MPTFTGSAAWAGIAVPTLSATAAAQSIEWDTRVIIFLPRSRLRFLVAASTTNLYQGGSHCNFNEPLRRDRRGKAKRGGRGRMLKLAATVVALLVEGVAYGMILFLMSVGLTITLGVMRIANLAHCGFAMVGGYIGYALATRAGLPLGLSLPLAAAATMLIGLALERTIFRWVYAVSELKQILMTIGLAFVMIASVNAAFGSNMNTVPVPALLAGTLTLGFLSLSAYRFFIILV